MALGEFVCLAAGGGSAALGTGCAALEIDASMVQIRDPLMFSLVCLVIVCMKANFPIRVSLSGVCQPADTDAVGAVDAAQPVGNTDEPSLTVTRGQNSTLPKRTTSLSKPQQSLKGVKSSFLLLISPLLDCPFLVFIISYCLSSFLSLVISILLLIFFLSCLFSRLRFSSFLISSPLFFLFLLF